MERDEQRYCSKSSSFQEMSLLAAIVVDELESDSSGGIMFAAFMALAKAMQVLQNQLRLRRSTG